MNVARAAARGQSRTPLRMRLLTGLIIGAGLGVVGAVGGGLASPASAAIGSVCPVPTGEVSQGIKVCTDRGDGATYQAGDRITVCVSANIPQIAIFPPPPAPTIRVENVTADDSTRQLIQAQMASGQQCVAGTIMAPFGQETVRAQAVNADGSVFQEDTVTFTTAPR